MGITSGGCHDLGEILEGLLADLPVMISLADPTTRWHKTIWSSNGSLLEIEKNLAAGFSRILLESLQEGEHLTKIEFPGTTNGISRSIPWFPQIHFPS